MRSPYLRISSLIALLTAISFAGCSSKPSSTEDGSAHQPGFVGRTMESVQFWKKKEPQAPKVNLKGVTLEMTLAPAPLKLSETRKISVILSLKNGSRRYVRMEFPTSQRVDVLLLDENGKTLNRWSEDQEFAQETSLLQLNPGERAEYNLTLPTRELVAGKTYTVQATVVNQPKLSISQSVVPEK